MKSFAIIICMSGAVLAAAAQPVPTSIITTNIVEISSQLVNILLEEARTNHPALKAAESRIRSATLNAEAIRTWEDPMAMLGGSVYSSKGFKPMEDGDLAYGIEQKLPLWNKPRLARKVAETETSTRQAEAELRIQELRRDIAKGLLAAALAERVVELGEQDVAWLDAIAQTTENKYRTGGAVLADSLQIQNESAKRKDSLRTDHNRLFHEQFTLNRLLNRPAESPWPSLRLPPVSPAIPLSSKLLNMALENQPRLKVMAQEIKQAQATAELTRKSRLPEVTLGVEGRQYSGDGEFRSGMFTLRFSVPWFNRDYYRKDYARDREKQNTAEHEREDQVLMVREELHHLSVEIEATRREALLYKDEISTRASQSVTSRLADWESGRGTFRDVVEARRMSVESELMSARATAEEHQMLAELVLWTGVRDVEALAPLANEPPIISSH